MIRAATDVTADQEQLRLSAAPTRGVDHVGVTVRDLDLAIHEVRNLLGGTLCYIEGPIVETEPGWMRRKLGAAGGPFSLRVAALTLGPLNLELFEYRPNDGARPNNSATGSEFMALFCTRKDPGDIIERLPSFCGAQASLAGSSDIQLASGLRLTVQRGNEDLTLPAFSLGVPHCDWMASELAERFGMRERAQFESPHGAGVALSAQEGTLIVLFRSPGLEGRPTNSDPGGHHIGFHADDVDASASALSGAGYRLFGQPETIVEGPIAGDRWIYLASPSGFQLELLNMPDGRLPYEAVSASRRNAIQTWRWS